MSGDRLAPANSPEQCMCSHLQKGAVMPKGIPRKKNVKIFWTDAETNQVAEAFVNLRIKRPFDSVTVLAEAAQGQLPKERQRKITGPSQAKELFEKIEEELKSVWQIQEENKSLRDKLNSRQEITPEIQELVLGSLTDSEVYERFADQVLKQVTPDDVIKIFGMDLMLNSVPQSQIVGLAAQAIFERYANGPEPTIVEPEPTRQIHTHVPTPKPNGKAKPRIALVGALPEQAGIIAQQLATEAEIKVIDKKKTTVPSGSDCYVAWARFLSHSVYDQCKKVAPPNGLVTHHGGIQTLIQDLRKWIKTR